MSKAHNLEEKERTKDVLIEEQVNFNALLLSEPTLASLQKNGFHKPSPIQLKAIPIGKCGFDLIVKAKSGTGKTLVFGLIALEAINLNKKFVQVLILAPTREIAVQIQNVLRQLGSEYKGLNVECFIGGLPVEEDLKKAQKCHIAVGAPGRVRHLVQAGVLNVKQVKLFVLDEVDKLLVQNNRIDIEEIGLKLPYWKQTIAVSATLTKDAEDYLEQCMSSPTLVEPTTDSPLLLGIRQFVDIVKTNLNIVHQLEIKSKELIRLLSQIAFTQCLVFTNYQTRAASVCNHLNRHGWNSMYIAADQKQSERLQVIDSLKSGKCRILLSTDLTARGIDAANVDLTINYDVPYEASTYLHRMGRAGRYGSKGLCITISTEEELAGLKKLLGSIAGANFLIARLPKHGDLPTDLINFDLKALQFERSVVDLVNIPEESKSILSSVVDLKTSKIPKRTNKRPLKKNEISKIKEESQSENQNNSQVYSSPAPDNITQSKDFQEAPRIVNMNARCFSQTTITASDVTLDQTEFSENIENQELTSLLTMLDRTDTPSNTSNFEATLTELSSDSRKKRKTNEPLASNSQQALCNKNVTLLHVAEILASPHVTEVTDEAKSATSQFVDTLNTNDATIDSNEVSNYINETHTEIQDTETNVPHNSEETSVENIFKLSYDYAVIPGAPNWVETLGVDLSEKAVLNEPDIQEAIPLNRSPKKHRKFSKHRKSFESKSEKMRKSSNNNSVKMTKNIHLNASFADDSFSNTPTECLSHHTQNMEPYNEGEGDLEHMIIESKIKLPLQNQYAVIEKPFDSEQCDHEYSGNKHFIECFQKYSDELTEKLQTFEDMANFESWYQQWQWQVRSVREYVQQNIYVQEMNRHMSGNH